ncbi:MAG: L-rhamnonate dehydratase [Candidatus Thermoplasmatota archaeon]|nr:L-rhamnonate dehydratase [Candidatus Thermoplasmatota archaeon]
MSRISSVSLTEFEEVRQPAYPYVKPTDYYKQYLGETSPVEAAMLSRICFARMTTESGLSSYIAVSEPVADFISNLSGSITGFDTAEISKAWDYLYRKTLPLGRAGLAMHAISAINLLMFDLLGKELKVPVYKLTGGATRGAVRAYASHLHPLPVKELQEEAMRYVEDGYRTMKMRFAAGPADPFAVERNIALVKAIRDAVGYEVELAGDAWMSWNYNFAVFMISRLEKFEMRWIEEPLLPDDFDGFSRLTRSVSTPISSGEHHYHVYDFKRLLDSGVTILQPDTTWVGGMTAMLKIASLAETYGAWVIPHSGNIYNLHFIVSQPESVAPMAEYLTKYREWMEQHASGIPVPEHGYIKLSEKPGFGITHDLK